MKLALSEQGLIQVYDLFHAAEQRCELMRRELAQKGDVEGAEHQARRRDEYARMRQRVLAELQATMPRSRVRRLVQILRSTWRHLQSMWRYYYVLQRP